MSLAVLSLLPSSLRLYRVLKNNINTIKALIKKGIYTSCEVYQNLSPAVGIRRSRQIGRLGSAPPPGKIQGGLPLLLCVGELFPIAFVCFVTAAQTLNTKQQNHTAVLSCNQLLLLGKIL